MIVSITFNNPRQLPEYKSERVYSFWFIIINKLGLIGVKKIESVIKDNGKEYIVIDNDFEFLRADIEKIEMM